MLLGKPLFDGNSEVEQLKKIFTILGSPKEVDYIWLRESPEWMGPESGTFKDLPGQPIKEAFKEIIDQNAVDLIGKMLVFDPEKRITAKDALDHAYFDNIKATIDEIYNK